MGMKGGSRRTLVIEKEEHKEIKSSEENDEKIVAGNEIQKDKADSENKNINTKVDSEMKSENKSNNNNKHAKFNLDDNKDIQLEIAKGQIDIINKMMIVDQ